MRRFRWIPLTVILVFACLLISTEIRAQDSDLVLPEEADGRQYEVMLPFILDGTGASVGLHDAAAQAVCTNVVKNPSFDSGTTSWKWWDPNCMSVQVDGDKSLVVSISKSCSNMQFYQPGVPLAPNSRYYLSFDAKSSRGQDMGVSLSKHTRPYTNYGLQATVDVTDSWTRYTLDLTTTGFTSPVSDGRLRFYFNGLSTSGDKYWLDNIRLSQCPETGVQADFSGTPRTTLQGVPVAFQDLSTGAPTTWNWDFGDGATSTQQHPSHTYTAPGTYTVALIASNASSSDSETKVNYIEVGSSLTAEFSATPRIALPGTPVAFQDLSTGAPTAWNWDFGDGTTSTAQHPSHTYSAPGMYSVTLTVNNASASDSETKTNYIDIGGPPTAAFSATPISVTVGAPVAFVDMSGGSPTAWQWTFGDGGTSAQANPSHTYDQPGEYTVKLTVSNKYGTNSEEKLGYIRVNDGFANRYILLKVDLSKSGEFERISALVNLADRYGYNGAILHDWGMFTLPGQSDLFLSQLNQLRGLFQTLDWDLVPWVTPGSSIGDITDPAYVEAFPVKDSEYTVGPIGSALSIRNTTNLAPNGGFEANLDGWWKDNEGVTHDTAVGRNDSTSVRLDGLDGNNRRLSLDMSTLNLKPFTTYKLTFWLKTDELANPDAPYARILRYYNLNGQSVGTNLLYRDRRYNMSASVQTTQEWTPYEIRFNSLDSDGTNSWPRLWFGTGGTTGTLWIDDVSLVESSLYRYVERDNRRKVVVSVDGIDLEPYVDYRIDGNDIINLRIVPSSVAEVDWYQTPDYSNSVQFPSVACSSNLAAQFDDDVNAIVSALSPKGVHVAWNELRVFGWSPECGNITSGELLADVTDDYQSRITNIDASVTQYFWSDMYDPYHHAVAPFYWASNGPFTGSWNGLHADRRTVVINWNSGSVDPVNPGQSCDTACQTMAKRDSLLHFDGLGACQMVAAYYDKADLEMDRQFAAALDSVLTTEPDFCLDGYLYATFSSDFTELCTVAQYWAEQGRWPVPVAECTTD